MERHEILEKARAGIKDFPAKSGNKALAKAILSALSIKGATVYFFTGGDDSEPEGAVIEVPGMKGHIEVHEASRLVDWRGVRFDSYQRFRDYPAFGRTPKYRLDESGELVSYG